MSARTNLKIQSVIVAFVLITTAPTFAGQTIYVDDDATGANDGSSWADAFNYLQDALAAAWSGDEIHVAQGIYKPDRGVVVTTGDREATFQLINGVTLKGGYASAGEPDPNARDIELYKTILNGDLDGNDIIDVNYPWGLWNEPTRAENSYHVVTGSGTDGTAVLDGFTITGGNPNAPLEWPFVDSSGAGMYNENGSPTVVNCIFRGNSARWGSGGMSNRDNSRPKLTNCTFVANSAIYAAAMFNWDSSPMLTNCTFSGNWATSRAGGIYNTYANPTLTNCTFSGNSAESLGGAIANYGSRPTLTNCTFSANWAEYGGGAMFNEFGGSPTLTNCTFNENSARYGGAIENHSSSNPTLTNCVFSNNSAATHAGGVDNIGCNPTLINCTFSGNQAGTFGGGMYNYAYSRPTLTNCTFAANLALNGNAIACDSYQQKRPNYIKVSNCIFWDGENGIWNNDNSTITITYSDIQSGWMGQGNIDDDPCFVEPGYWDTNGLWIEGDYHLLPDSPCIDAGDPNYIAEPNETDLDGRPRVINGRIDMGAYEAPIPAEARILPRTINLASKGKLVTCHCWLPEGYDVADIDPNNVFLERQIKAEEFLVDEHKQVATAAFDREKVQSILNVGNIELKITCQLTDGTYFEATDVVQVTDKGIGK